MCWSGSTPVQMCAALCSTALIKKKMSFFKSNYFKYKFFLVSAPSPSMLCIAICVWPDVTHSWRGRHSNSSVQLLPSLKFRTFP